jgi:NAD(P)-dependent dehydrogenase (short-subunit alcohol dehydrogenase family)
MNILIAGASGGIGNELGKTLLARGHQLSSLSRSGKPGWSQQHLQLDCTRTTAVESMSEWLNRLPSSPDCVIQCAGILHTETQRPEKSLGEIDIAWLAESMRVNLVAHLQLAQAVSPLVSRQHPVRWLSLSARVSSMGDNYLGGWHSYRMSKAALNMLIRNISIEWARKSPESVVIAVHPGTTDSPLSVPFQKNIPEDKLYSPQLTATRLADIAENLTADMNGKLINWDGKTLPY